MGNLRAYYQLAKPGIIYGNLLAVGAGFFIASRGDVNPALLVETAVAVALIIGSACAVNNYIDRDIDKVMARTKRRPLAIDSLSGRQALVFAALIGLAGFVILGLFCNALTFLVGIIAYIDYVVLYGWSKRRGWYGTLVGSVSGSAPLTAGYTTVTGRFDGGAILLFLLMACWQMPHFYAIAIRRFKDYKAVRLPVLPAAQGIRATKLQIVAFIAAFLVTDILLYATGYVNRLFVVVIGLYGAIWLRAGIRGLPSGNDQLWTKKMFLYSLIFLPLLFVVSLSFFIWPR